LALSKQIHLYSVDTDNFYYQSEDEIHTQLIDCYIYRSKVRKERKKITKIYDNYAKELLEKAVSMGLKKSTEPNIHQTEKDDIDGVYKQINKIIRGMKKDLCDKFNENKGSVRTLKKEELTDKKVVSVFDSALTRIIKAKPNILTDEMVIVQTFFFEILEDIILNGFIWNDEKYIVYTASAGQIRTKKTVFIKESTWEKYKNTITCGLTDDVINERGEININKHLAYKALQNSATEEWTELDIDKTIVVPDFETDVECLVDFIDHKTYKIDRKIKKVPIPHTDGAGIMLPSFCNKGRMVRLPWMKGLLIPFDFKKFIYQHSERDKINYAVIKDIYGQPHDIIKEDIQIIFTESQFKMHKFYWNWSEYKKKYKEFYCQAGYCNEEGDNIKNARLNYQMLQSLVYMEDSEIEKVCEETNEAIVKITKDKDTMMKLMGVREENTNKNNYQKGIQYYPQLLNDSYSKHSLRQVKRSTVKRGREGKIFIDGKYTFISPDMYAFAERLFLGIESPVGLLQDGEVSCNLYEHNEELDCLRSPHLYLEHAIRENKIKDVHSEWFISKSLYTSCHDPISKLLQFDCDGDESLVCHDKTIIEVAKRNIEHFDVVPLYYNMESAITTSISRQSVYKGLTDAYKGGNIGIISNDISKIWNSGDVDIDAIKFLTMENNFSIDFAKTLYKLERPKWANDKILKYTRNKLPHFFKHAKDKRIDSIEQKNDSTVNRLDNIVKNPNLNFKSACGRFYYKRLMNDPNFQSEETDGDIIGEYEKLEHKSTFMINRSGDYTKVRNVKFVYDKIRDGILEICDDPIYVTDVLIGYLYNHKKENRKITLWECFGDIIIENIKKNLTKDFTYEVIECEECGILIEKTGRRTKYCDKCWVDIEKRLWRESKRRARV